MLRLLANLCLVTVFAGCAVEPAYRDWRERPSEPQAGEPQAVVPPPVPPQVHAKTNESHVPPDTNTDYAARRRECDFGRQPVRECSDELKQSLRVVGERLDVRLPVCGQFLQSYEPPDPVTQATHAAQLEVGDGGESISVGSIYDTVIIRGTIVHEPVIRPASDSSKWDGGINVLLSCLVYPPSE